jgi:hypothetical protein
LLFRYRCVRVFTQNPLPKAVVYQHDRTYPAWGASIIPNL